MSHRFPLIRITRIALLSTSVGLMTVGCGLTSRNKLADTSDPEATLMALADEAASEDDQQLADEREGTSLTDAAPAPPEELGAVPSGDSLPASPPTRLVSSGPNLLQGGLLAKLRGANFQLSNSQSEHDQSAAHTLAEDDSDLTADHEIESKIAPRPVEQVTSENFREEVLESNVPVMVDFYADWCGPCKLVAPELGRFALQQSDVRVVKVNIDQDKKLAKSYRVRSYPTVLLFEGGSLVAQYVGIDDIRKAIRQ